MNIPVILFLRRVDSNAQLAAHLLAGLLALLLLLASPTIRGQSAAASHPDRLLGKPGAVLSPRP